MDREILVEARALTRVADGGAHVLLQPVNFALRRGDHVAITGSSGSGKSVFLRTLALLDGATCGDILWQGKPIADAQVPRYRSRICYLSQKPVLLEGTVEDNLRFPYTLKASRHLQFSIDKVRALLDRAGKGSGFLTKAAGDLSGGEAQVVSLIRTLQLDPDVLLLDEPTAALDPVSAREIEALIQAWFEADAAQERAFIWVSHDLQQARRMAGSHWTMDAGVLTGPESQ
ncbi:ATP-binding cassette domain-containing protein [Pseudomonas sp. Pseusp122]|uniref:ABC transporter ATP-binding protein n=1 Tax=unclassified Pseudomonas TaxID=196821 RepID=UPI0039A54C11